MRARGAAGRYILVFTLFAKWIFTPRRTTAPPERIDPGAAPRVREGTAIFGAPRRRWLYSWILHREGDRMVVFVAWSLGTLVGVLIGYLFARLRSRTAAGEPEEAGRLREALQEHGQLLSAVRERARGLEERLRESREQEKLDAEALLMSREENARLLAQAAATAAELARTREQAGEKVREITAAREHLVTTFRATAAELLVQTREQGVAEQQERLNFTLRPFQDQLKGFQELVARTYSEEGRDRVALKKEIELLAERHQTLAREAQALTQALTGNAKVRGDWGEITLRRILERSGLREGHEFRLQESTTLSDGSRLRPDVVVSLPGEGALVIDAKLQLVSWMKLCAATTPQETAAAGAELVAAIRAHLRSLDRKAYASLYRESVDLVVMYLPIDAALLAALAAEPALYDEAFSRGVVLTGPTLLMALLGSLAHQWRSRHQENNILKIARLAESLGEKLENFLKSYQSLGQRLRLGVQDYNKGLNQLATGQGNVLKKAADLGELGIKSARRLGVEWSTLDLSIEASPLLDLGDDDPPEP
jgi:DNA recombination protein RmuC